MPRERTGSVFRRSQDGIWVGAVSLGDGKRRRVYGPDEATVRAKMTALGADPPPVEGRTKRDLRAMVAAIATAVVARSRQLGWTDEFTGTVLAAGVTRARVAHGITGPCVYCGTEVADSVDHAVPLAFGGDDSPENLVSACFSCNNRKGNRTAADWAAAQKSDALLVQSNRQVAVK